jgi:MFS family permease
MTHESPPARGESFAGERAIGRLLRRRPFLLLLGARTVSHAGNAMAPVALAFAVLEEFGSATALGVVIAARMLPQMALLLVGGAWADRLPRTRVMAAADLLAGAAQATAAALILSSRIAFWQLLVLQAANGGAVAFFFPASQGVVPQVAPAGRLQQANAVLSLSGNLARIGGAALAGVIIAATSPGWAMAVDAATFLLSAALVLCIPAVRSAPAVTASILTSLREGWQAFRSRRWVWAVVIRLALVDAAWNGASNVLGPVVAESSLGGAAAWALIMAAFAAGALLGSLVALRLRPARPLLVGNLVELTAALPLILLAVEAPLPAIVASYFATGACFQFFSVLFETAIQSNLPRDLLSRISSYALLAGISLMPAGAALAGPAGDLLGIPAALWTAMLFVIIPTVAVAAIPEVRRLSSPAGAAPPRGPS